MKVIFDLDPAVYMSAFSAQRKEYTIVYEDEYGMHEKVFQDGNEKNAWKRSISSEEYDGPAIEILDETPHLVVEDESHARQSAKTVIESALKEIERRFKTQVTEVLYFLTGKGNFREKVATIAKYKGNRDNMEKPVHYQAVRDYYVDDWGAYIVEGMEADDEVSIRMWEHFRDGDEEVVLATIDKDLDQIPGWHYDYKKHVFYDIDPLEGELFFYAQCVSGDATDNIKGCYRIGAKKAADMVNEWFGEAQMLCLDPQNQWRRYIWDRIVDTYEVNMKQYPEKHEHGLCPAAAAHENAILVYMLQERDEAWEPPKSC